jgi:hypothetical protein
MLMGSGQPTEIGRHRAAVPQPASNHPAVLTSTVELPQRLGILIAFSGSQAVQLERQPCGGAATKRTGGTWHQRGRYLAAVSAPRTFSSGIDVNRVSDQALAVDALSIEVKNAI